MYFDMAANGENVIVTRNNKPSVVVSAVQDFNIEPSKDVTAKLVQSLHELKGAINGTVKTQSAKEFLDEL